MLKKGSNSLASRDVSMKNINNKVVVISEIKTRQFNAEKERFFHKTQISWRKIYSGFISR